jgi:hypothetical protein
LQRIFFENKISCRNCKSVRSPLGQFEISKKILEKLPGLFHGAFSPLMQEICKTIGVNNSYAKSEEALEDLTGVHVSDSTIRAICGEEVPEWELKEIVNKEVCEMSVDGGNICIIGDKAEWKQYKAARINGKFYAANLKEDEKLVNKLQGLDFAKPVSALGDGHDSTWNIFKEIECERREILDWYHLVENLHKQQIGKEKLEEVKKLLWKGEKDKAIQEFEIGNNFRKYMEKHYKRLVNYEYYQSEGLTIGSGAVESAIKQINSRINLTGARWKLAGARKMLRLRCNYLNGKKEKSQKHIKS